METMTKEQIKNNKESLDVLCKDTALFSHIQNPPASHKILKHLAEQNFQFPYNSDYEYGISMAFKEKTNFNDLLKTSPFNTRTAKDIFDKPLLINGKFSGNISKDSELLFFIKFFPHEISDILRGEKLIKSYPNDFSDTDKIENITNENKKKIIDFIKNFKKEIPTPILEGTYSFPIIYFTKPKSINNPCKT